MAERETVTVQEAAEMLHVAPQAIREMMKRKVVDIGVVVPSTTGRGKRYLIFRNKLNALIGKSND